ncbi:hypothetical protein ScPMuIL_016811 [Solemya velum]
MSTAWVFLVNRKVYLEYIFGDRNYVIYTYYTPDPFNPNIALSAPIVKFPNRPALTGVTSGTPVLLKIAKYERNHFSIFSRHGIKGPDPLPVIGNMYTVYKLGLAEAEKAWTLQYGKVHGAFIGHFPTLTIADLDIVREILVKRFHNFTDRAVLDLQPTPVDKGLFFQCSHEWKRLRRIISPTFSGSKLKHMIPYLNDCAKSLTDILETFVVSGQSMPAKEIFSLYTTNAIATTAFGIQVETGSDQLRNFIKLMKKIFDDNGVEHPVFVLSMMFPPLASILRIFGLSWPRDAIKVIVETGSKLIEERNNNEMKRVDFLQLLLDAKLDEDDSPEDKTPHRRRLSKDEILGQIIIFFLAGYETTGSLLQFTTYELSINQDLQDELYREIQEQIGKDNPTYESIGRLRYMDQVLAETLRKYPPVRALSRLASETVTINGLVIPKGVSVNIPVYSIHRDPAIYHNPDEFKPERFSPEAKAKLDPFSYLPFGFGQRNCVGMRLALIEAKIALIHSIQKFRFTKCDETEIPLSLKHNTLVQARRPIKMKIVRR